MSINSLLQRVIIIPILIQKNINQLSFFSSQVHQQDFTDWSTMAGITLAVAFVALASGASAMTPTQFGIEMGTRAYEGVCWYENLKQFPKTDMNAFVHCTTQAEQVQKRILDQAPVEDQQEYFTKWLPNRMAHLPSDYSSHCNSHLESGSQDTSDNEGETLGDQGHAYPFRAFAYCMIKTLKERHGDQAAKDVGKEKIRREKNWMTTMNERENEFRALHGSAPLKLDKKLSELAQKWSDENAEKCRGGYHIPKGHPDGFYQPGKTTGENLADGTVIGKDKKEVIGLMSVDGWYEEIKDYPYAQGGLKNPKSSDPLFKKVGHFTQMVWAGSERVGYGYAFNPTCHGGRGSFFVTARYYPAGNSGSKFAENVKPVM